MSAFDTALARLRAVQARLDEHAAAGPPPGLTEPDPGGTERWEAGQVWAHLAEFPAYWLGQIQHILERRSAGDPEPVPFGRTKTDLGRIAAIERDRNEDPEALLTVFSSLRPNVVAYAYSLDGDPAVLVPADSDGTATVTITPDRPDYHYLSVHSRAADGSESNDTFYQFCVNGQ